jgi:hypothetical protein
MYHFPSKRLLSLSLILLVTFIVSSIVTAQDAPNPTLAAEFNIGFSCPVSATLSPDQKTVWLLMNNCGSGGFTLQGFNISDGSPVKADDKPFADVLAPLKDKWIYSDTKPLAFTPDGVVDIRYNDPDTYDGLNLRLSLDGKPVSPTNMTVLTNDVIQQLISGYAGYPETNTYNADHTLAVIIDTNAFHIIDLETGTERLLIDMKTSTDYSSVVFSQDSKRLYMSTAKNIDDPNDMRSVLSIYDLADGKLLESHEVPSALNTVSPDGRFAVGYVGGQYDAGLIVTNLETGASSASVLVNEPSHLVTECLNTGHKLKGLDFKTSGELPVIDIIWLPDSSGFLTINSYGGEGASGDSGGVCIFNYSRLRQYNLP